VGLSECGDRIELAEICPVGAFIPKNKENIANEIGGES
jgi:NADH dehydrogenase/NADH:ubiquinone oxidoreductase subunit G